MKLMPLKPMLLSVVLCPLLAFGQGHPKSLSPVRDTTQHIILRNAPGGFSMQGLIISPLMIEGSPSSFPFSIGAGYAWQHHTLWDISVLYQKAYLELGKGLPENGQGINMQLSCRAEASGQLSIHTWEEKKYYQLKLKEEGRKQQFYSYPRGVKTKTITARAGFAYDNRHIGASSKKELNFIAGPANVRQAHTMMRSYIITLGMAYNIFSDIAIDANPERYQGKRSRTSHTVFYADLLYAADIRLQDIEYPYLEGEPPVIQRLSLSATTFDKAGVRLGVRETAAPFRKLMTVTTLEVGMRPGISGEKSANMFCRAAYGFMLGKLKR